MSSFTDDLEVEILDARREGRVTARLLAGFAYHVGELGSGEVISVPAGFITDFASVPWGLWNLEPPLGDAGKAAVVHDFLYATAGTGVWNGRRQITRAKPYSRAEADAIFREAMKVLSVPAWKRALLWAAVRLGGAGGWGK